MPEPLLRYSTLMLCLICLGSLSAGAQTDSVMVTDDGSHWNGEWIAEGTLFRVAVTVQDNVLELAEVQSLGFVWSAQPGTISGSRRIRRNVIGNDRSHPAKRLGTDTAELVHQGESTQCRVVTNLDMTR